jgi:hypothetical protein
MNKAINLYINIPMLVVLSIGAAVAGLVAASAQEARKPASPDVKLVRTIRDCSGFKEAVIHPTRYILSQSKTVPFPPAVVYDIQENSLKEINLRALGGMPVPGEVYGPERSRLQLEGGYWRIYDLSVVYYNGPSSPAGAVLEKVETHKTVPDGPFCAKCGAPASFIEKYQRYYCYHCKEYVKESDYLKDIHSLHYISFVASQNTVSWMEKIAEGSFYKIGMDPEGRNFYFFDTHPLYGEETTKDSLTVYRFNVESRTVDWRYTVKTPVRSRKTAAGSYTMNAFASPDFSRIVLWEYDEEYELGSRKGWLKNPPAMGYVIDVAASSHFEINVPSTPYGQIIDRSNRYLLLGSNQYGSLHRIDLEKKKEDLAIQGSKGMFFFTLSESGKNLYVFTKTMVEVRSWPDLKIVKTIPLSKIIPGVGQLLTSEAMIGTNDGKFAVIGVLEKAPNGPWWSATSSSGFHLMSIGD